MAKPSARWTAGLAACFAITAVHAQESSTTVPLRFSGTAIGRSYFSETAGSPGVSDPPDRIGEEFLAADLYAGEPAFLDGLSTIRSIRLRFMPDGAQLLISDGISNEPRDERILVPSVLDEWGSIWVSELPMKSEQLDAAPDCTQESGLAERAFLGPEGEVLEYQVLLYVDYGASTNSRSACRVYLEEAAPELTHGNVPSSFWGALTWSGALDLNSIGDLIYADIVFRFVQ